MKSDFTYRGLIEDIIEWLKEDAPESLNEKQKAMLKELHFEHKEHSKKENIIILKMGTMPTMFKVYLKEECNNPLEAPDHAYEAMYRLLMCNGFLATLNSAILAHQNIMNKQIKNN